MNRFGRVPTLSALAVTLVAFSGCAANDPYQKSKAGAAIGAVAGAVLGSQTDSKSGALAGALIGALAGGAVGYYMDNQQREFEQALDSERRSRALEIERLKDDTLKLSLNSEVSFDLNRDEIKPAFRNTLDKLGAVINKYDRTVVHVVGHTDSSGSAAHNQDLSERRAGSVSRYLEQQGVTANRLRSEGRGEREPRDTNATEAGRQLNRRVEIFIRPLVEGQEQKAFESPYRSGT